MIVAERESKVTFIDETIPPDEQAAGSSAARSRFTWATAYTLRTDICVNRWGHSVYNFNTVRANLGRDAQFLGMAAGTEQDDEDADRHGDAEERRASGPARRDVRDARRALRLQHAAEPHRRSHVQRPSIQSALTGSASRLVRHHAYQSDGPGGSEANQTSRNLLLSEHARAAPIPILEIEAQRRVEVQPWRHRGPADEDDLFYLEVRAIRGVSLSRCWSRRSSGRRDHRIPNERLRERVRNAAL